MKPNNSDIELLVKVARLFYEQDKTQKEIAEILSLSKSQVCRMLAEARRCGIVRITITSPFANEERLAEIIKEKYGLQEVYLCNDGRPLNFANFHAEFLAQQLKKYKNVSVMSGRTVGSVIDALPYNLNTKGNFYPLVGFYGTFNNHLQAYDLVRVLAEKTNGFYETLNAPVILKNSLLAKLISEDPTIGDVLNKAKDSELALVGIGATNENATSYKSGAYTIDDIKVLKEQNIVGIVCCSFYNENGEIIEPELQKRTVGVKLTELENSTVWAFASDEVEFPVLRGALRTKRINILSTTVRQAELLAKEN